MNIYKCRAIQFSYNQEGFTIIINSKDDVEYIAFYKEISDGDYVGGLDFLFGDIWNGQTDDELINMLIEYAKNNAR